MWIAVLTYLSYGILAVFGHFRDLLRSWGIDKSSVTEPVKPVSIFIYYIYILLSSFQRPSDNMIWSTSSHAYLFVKISTKVIEKSIIMIDKFENINFYINIEMDYFYIYS